MKKIETDRQAPTTQQTETPKTENVERLRVSAALKAGRWHTTGNGCFDVWVW